jgi:hypothetical protein
MMNFFYGIFRNIMFFFDEKVYGFIPTVYNFILDLARITIFDFESLQRIANNVYGVLGLFLIFRVAFILLNAIIDPDKLTNKDTGVAKILSKVVISLALIAIIPWGFQAAFALQKSILENGVIERLILGRSTSEAGSAVTNSGEYLGELSLRAFLTCDKDVDPIACDNLDLSFSEAFPQGTGNTKANFTDLRNNLNQTTIAGGKQEYAYDYNAGLSTICGGVILFMLVSFCFDIAVRSVKLGFLQMITPLAVVGYIEPKGDIFKNWLKMSISTYVNLFIRILSISFVTFTLSSLNSNLGVIYGKNLGGTTKTFAYIFIILGLLIFAKELPNMLSSLIPGMKEANLGSLNPLKKLGAVPFVGGAAVAGIGLAGGLAMKGVAGGVGGLSGGFSSLSHHGSFRAGLKQGASGAAKGVPLKGGLGKQVKSMFPAWHKGAVAGASGATGKENTKVGLGAYMEHRKNITSDQQSTATSKYNSSIGSSLYNKIKDIDKNNPDKFNAIAGGKSNDYTKAMYNKSIMGDLATQHEKRAQTAVADYQKGLIDQQAYDDIVDQYKNAKKEEDYYQSELERMDKMEQFSVEAQNRSLYEKAKSQAKTVDSVQSAIDNMNKKPNTDNGQFEGQTSMFDDNNNK